MSDELLNLDARLLILRYGRLRVLQALSKLNDQTTEQLQQELHAAEQRRRMRAKRPAPSILDLVESKAQERPDIAEPLRALALAFQNQTFLPQLRDLQRFLDRIGASHGKIKSRAAGAPLLVRTLAELPRESLVQLVAEGKSVGESDYSLLARAIMGKRTKPQAE